MPEREFKTGEAVVMASVARMHFVEGKAKTVIADELGMSRFRVARILERARESGLVRVHVEIALPTQIDAELSNRLRDRFGLHYAAAVATPDHPEEILRARLGEVAAGLLSELVEESDVLGIAWGRTLDAMIASTHRLAPCTVVQLTGSMADSTGDSVETFRGLASLSGGPSYPLYAPLIVDSAEIGTGLRRQPLVAKTLEQYVRLTKAVVAVGSWDPPNSQLYDAMAPGERAALKRKGVLAEVCAIPLDEDGGIVEDLVDRVIGIGADQIRNVPEVVVVAGGRTKVSALGAVLKAGLVTSLITDAATAGKLVDAAGPAPAPDRRAPRKRLARTPAGSPEGGLTARRRRA